MLDGEMSGQDHEERRVVLGGGRLASYGLGGSSFGGRLRRTGRGDQHAVDIVKELLARKQFSALHVRQRGWQRGAGCLQLVAQRLAQRRFADPAHIDADQSGGVGMGEVPHLGPGRRRLRGGSGREYDKTIQAGGETAHEVLLVRV